MAEALMGPQGGTIDKITKNIKKVVDSFLSRNADIFGFAYVAHIVMSRDHREARIFVHFERDPLKGEKLLNEKKYEVSQAINNFVTMKYPPKIRLEGIDNEAINI